MTDDDEGQHRGDGDTTERTDPLTGALPREALASVFDTAQHVATSIGLLMIDLDNFKSINDAFGHATGDLVLHTFAADARSVLRANDTLIRYGGDEFVVVLPSASLAAAHEVAERVRISVAGHAMPTTPPLTVSVSVGCSCTDATTPQLSLTDLLAQADGRLYQAKRRGRNQVVSVEDVPSAAEAAEVAADTQGRLIERDGAFTQALTWLDAVLAGERGLLRVVGAPGVGMSRFLEAVARMARLRGYQVLTLTGSPALGLRQYGALSDALSSAPSGEQHDAHELLEVPAPGEARGFLVILDRASDIDASTLELVWQLVAHPGAGRIGVVVGHNPAAAEVGRLPDLRVRAEVRLQPFSVSGLQVWLRTALRWEAPTDFSLWLYAQTDGYPALLQAALQHVRADGLLTRQSNGSGWDVSPLFREYDLRGLLQRERARAEEASELVRPYGLLVGRTDELRTIKQSIAGEQLVVLAGHGGVGKTHLALQAAAEVGPLFADGAVVVPLAATTAVEFVALALVRALALAVVGQQEPYAVAVEYLTARDMLVVFDTVEDLPGIGVLVQDLLAVLPRLRMLMTTRDAAAIQADAIITVDGLRDAYESAREDSSESMTVAEGAGTATASASDGLADRPMVTGPLAGAALLAGLAERALATPASDLYVLASGHGVLDAIPDSARMATIRRLCRSVHGYPLAIKMLASWTGFFGHEGVALRLEQQVQAATGVTTADVPGIAISPMQAVFGFFWALLAERDRRSIGGLALFRGGFSAEAALDVADVTPFLLAALADRAFIQTERIGQYRLHALLRQYAWSWLQQDAQATAAVKQRHADWYLRLAAAAATDIRGPRFRDWVEQLEIELDNLRTALTWALDQAPLAALQAALDLAEFWLAGFYAREGYSWVEISLACAENCSDGLAPPLRMAALGRLGSLARQCGDTDAARLHLTAAVALAEDQRAGSDGELAYSLGVLSNVESDLAAHDRAVDLARRAQDCARRLGSPKEVAFTANMTVWPLIFAGSLEEATRVAEEGMQASAACGDRRSTANLMNAKATIAYYDPARHGEAIALYKRTIELYDELHDRSGVLLSFNNLASVYVDDVELDLAAQAFAEARRMGQRLKQHHMMANVLSGSGMVASLRGDDVAAWGFWREAMERALASSKTVILEECAIGLAYVWAQAGFTEQAAVVLGMIGLQPSGKPWLLLPIERVSALVRPALSAPRWEALLRHGAGLTVSAMAQLLLMRTGPLDVPTNILPDVEGSAHHD